MTKVKGPITRVWEEARKLIKEGNLEEAEQVLDKGILLMALHTKHGDKDLIEGTKKETWAERFWISLENHIWPTRPDYIENWKC